MTLVEAIWVLTALLAIQGISLLWAGAPVQKACKAFLRSNTANFIVFGAAALWFLWKIWNLSEADFGNYKHLLLPLFALTAVGAFRYMPDFLSVRGLAILTLLFAQEFLRWTWMQYSAAQNLANAIIYIYIILALIIGASPYRLRDFFDWVFAKAARSRGIGILLLILAVCINILPKS